jgi:uncharacterized protein
MIPRHASPRLLRLLATFPVVTITGPRQSGKTTLVRKLLPHKPYVSLEAPAQREFARAQPDEFLQQYPDGALIDEAQNAPEIFSQMQEVVDNSGQIKTVRHWLSILETCYLIHFVRPHSANYGKRLLKSPKL